MSVGPPNSLLQVIAPGVETLAAIPDTGIIRDYDGTIVTFRAGPAVSSVELPSDSSTIQIINLPQDTTTGGIIHLLDSLGYPTTETCIRITSIGDTLVARVKVQDASFAKGVTKLFQEQLGEASESEMSMEPLIDDKIIGNRGCRIQMSTVRCSWNSSNSPRNSSPGAVKELLRQHGKLEWFKPRVGSYNSTVYARFSNLESASKAVNALHNTKPDNLGGNVKLYVNKIISVRYSISTKIVDALKPLLVEIGQDLQQNGYVRLKLRSRPSKSFETFILTGQALDAVVHAKSAIETLLDGSIVKNDEAALWDQYFLSTDALYDLCNLRGIHKVYIHRDTRKHQLVLYGGSVAQQVAVTEALVAKVRSLRPPIYRLVLTPDLLQTALHGGILRINKLLGSAAYLDVSHDATTMTLAGGTAKEFQDAVELLLEGGGDEKTLIAEECPICEGKSREPLRTPCGHNYCKECFELQCTSATSSPGSWSRLLCRGSNRNGEECEHTFTLDELRSMVSSTTFEALLRSAFDAYIGGNPEDFHFCPTPDCTQVYRHSGSGGIVNAHGDGVTTSGDKVTTRGDEEATNGAVVTCSSCLTAICTKCHVIRHDGYTCKQFKGLGEEVKAELEKAKVAMGARDCPKCATTIVKSEGCNHVQCLACQVHICWKCMRTFEDAKVPRLGEDNDGVNACYNHMVNVHGSEFDEDDEDGFEDENDL